MEFRAEVKYLNREMKPGVKDPTKTYYKVLVMQGAQAPDFDCKEAVYNRMDGLKEMQPITAIFDYNPQYRSIMLKDFVVGKN